ncbi:hypothetical protein RFUL19S_03604 [Rhizobacter fulvus]
MLNRLGHWVIFIALVLQLVPCVFFGQSNMPEVPF